MLTLFHVQLFVSFIVGGILIAFQTLIAERFSYFWRGIILTIPTTMALGLFFVGLVKSPADIPEVTLIIPAALGVVYVYVFAFAYLSRYGIFVTLIGSFLLLFFFAYLLFLFQPKSFFFSVLYSIPLVAFSYFGLNRFARNFQLKPYSINYKNIFFRSFLAGIIVILIVFFSKTLGNIWGGFFSVFPASFTSTFIIYFLTQGKESIPSVAKSLFFPGSIGFILYVYAVALTFPLWGIWIGTLLSYLTVFLFFWIYSIIRNRFVGLL